MNINIKIKKNTTTMKIDCLPGNVRNLIIPSNKLIKATDNPKTQTKKLKNVKLLTENDMNSIVFTRLQYK